MIASIVLGIFTIQCKKNSSKNYIKVGSLTTLPIALNEFTALVPMGSVSPPGHVFPNDHMGFYYVKDNPNVTIYCPGNLHLTEIKTNYYTYPGDVVKEDYALYFGVNGESTIYFGHISMLSDKLKGLSGKTICESYSAGTGILKACRKSVSIDLAAGEILGYSNKLPGQLAMDMGMTENNRAVSPLDYFDAATRALLEPRVMGAPNAYHDGILRTAMPIGGEVYQDVAGTLQGNWLQQGFDKTPEINNVAFIKDYIIPEELIISFGSSVPVFGPGTWKFNQQNTGQVNRAYVDVKPDGKIYCYDPLYLVWDPAFPTQGIFPNNSFIVKLENSTTLSIQTRDCNCSEQIPYVFTAAKTTYHRE